LRGLGKVDWQFLMTAAAFNLWQLPKIQTADGAPGRDNGLKIERLRRKRVRDLCP